MVWSTSTLRIYGTAESQTQPKITLPTVQAQESGEQFQLQDDIQYALDGLCSSALPCDRAGSAAKIAEMAVTRRGRLALRWDCTSDTNISLQVARSSPSNGSCAAEHCPPIKDACSVQIFQMKSSRDLLFYGPLRWRTVEAWCLLLLSDGTR